MIISFIRSITTLYLLCISCSLYCQNIKDPHMNDFNFWIGEWDVYQNGTDKIVGHSIILSILNGNAIQENYTANSGKYEGTSLNKYNQEKRIWEQFYVDNSGLTLHITGKLEEGKMVLTNSCTVLGKITNNRISWTAQEDGTVRQLWEQKQEEQTDWQIAFDGIYKKKS